jgi:hypothetical protein
MYLVFVIRLVSPLTYKLCNIGPSILLKASFHSAWWVLWLFFFHAPTLISIDKLEAGSSYFYPSLKKINLWVLDQKNIYMCVYCHMSKKIEGWSVGISIFFFFFFFFFFFWLSAKPEIVVPESDSYILFLKFTVKWRIMQFFYLLCSQFRQKASSWINKTLLLVKQQKWLSEFCVKMHRIANKN